MERRFENEAPRKEKNSGWISDVYRFGNASFSQMANR